MPVDHIRYDLLARDALRGVVRRVLTDVAKRGLPGEHHFFISIDTRAPGVKISPRMRTQYPQEITIVLQHQFWDLIVTEQNFEVGLSFSGVPERLVVPFEAIKGFADPSVQFALQFEANDEGAAGGGPDPLPADVAPPEAKPKPGRRPPRVPAPPKPAANTAAPALPAGEAARKPEAKDAKRAPDAAAAEAPKTPAGGAEVVRLDRFRKK